AAEVGDGARVVRAGEPEPGLLDGVLRLGQGAEHAVGDRPQVSAVFLEAPRQRGVVVALPGHRELLGHRRHRGNTSKATAGRSPSPNRLPVSRANGIRKPRTYVSGSSSVSASM